MQSIYSQSVLQHVASGIIYLFFLYELACYLCCLLDFFGSVYSCYCALHDYLPISWFSVSYGNVHCDVMVVCFSFEAAGIYGPYFPTEPLMQAL